MNVLGILLIVLGIIYLIYSMISRNKITMYFKNIKIVKGKEDKYLKLQLQFAILNSLIFIVIGIIVVLYDLKSPFIMLTPLILHIINYIMQKISRTKGYTL